MQEGRRRMEGGGERETNKISFDLDEGTGVVVVGRPLEMRIGPVAREGWCGDERPRVGTL